MGERQRGCNVSSPDYSEEEGLKQTVLEPFFNQQGLLRDPSPVKSVLLRTDNC